MGWPLCSVQGRFHLPEQLTINVLGQLTACNLVCSLAVSIHWTGLLDWTTGLTQNAFSSLYQCRREANHVYSAYFFAKFTPLLRP